MTAEVSKYYGHIFFYSHSAVSTGHWIVCLVALNCISRCICVTQLCLLFKLNGANRTDCLSFAGEGSHP